MGVLRVYFDFDFDFITRRKGRHTTIATEGVTVCVLMCTDVYTADKAMGTGGVISVYSVSTGVILSFSPGVCRTHTNTYTITRSVAPSRVWPRASGLGPPRVQRRFRRTERILRNGRYSLIFVSFSNGG